MILFGTIYDFFYGIIPGVLFIKNLPYQKRNHSCLDQTDEDIIAQFKETQNNSLIGILFDRYIHLVFASCMKYYKDEDNAQDAAMELFESIPEKLLKHKIQSFKSWLYTTTRNFCLMRLRKVNLMDRIENFEKIAELSVDFQDDLHPNNEEINEVLNNYLKDLKEEQRICLEHMYLNNMSYQDISEKTGYALKHVKSYIQNGKRNLKIKLEKYYDEQEG